MANPHPMSPLSAAQTLATWIARHQRFPVEGECVASNGLLHWGTVYKLFPGSCFSARISAALALPGVVAHLDGPAVKLRPCLGPGCNVSFWTTPDVRLCPACHKKGRQREDETVEDSAVARVNLRRWGVGMSDWTDEVQW